MTKTEKYNPLRQATRCLCNPTLSDPKDRLDLSDPSDQFGSFEQCVTYDPLHTRSV